MPKVAKDIQEVLRWAYQVECVDRASSGSAEVCLRSGIDSVVKVERGAAGGGGTARLVFGSSVHPDAEVIHAAVMLPEDRGGLNRIERGLIISHARGGTEPDPLVGAVPAWFPKINGRGRPVAIYDGQRNVIGHEVIPGIRLVDGRGAVDERRGSPHEAIAFFREQYALWWGALYTLADALAGALESIEVLSPAAAPRPWLGHASTKVA